MDMESGTSPPVQKGHHGKEGNQAKKYSPDGSHRLLISPVKKLSALRLVSPVDMDQEQNDLEVASVLAEGGTVSPTKAKRHETPVRPATVMTNVQRGNVQTTTPVFQNLTIHQLAAQGELNMLRQEADNGAELDRLDEYGLSPLLWAAANGQLLTVQYLVSMRVDLNVVGNHGENALLFASCYGYTDIVKVLLKLGMDVNHADEMGGSALMYAAYNNHTSCVKVLLENGADLTLQNEAGHTALDLALGQGHKAVQQTIDNHILSLMENLT